MQHLFDCYGDFDIEVPCVVSTSSCCRQTDYFGHGYEYADFLEFPAMHGWKLDEENYSLRLLTLDERRAYEESRQHRPNAMELVPVKSREAFIQAWLFFALISCIVKKDGHPLLKFSDLTRVFQQGPRTRNMNGLVDTAKLQTALDEWHRSERINRSTSKLRLVQADLILELARQVVRTNLAKSAPHDFKADSVISISIMILGETLSAVKKKITESVGAAVRGWHAEDQEGWGPPEYVFSRMEEQRFCPHARRVLSIQMGTNATLLLAALKHHAGAKDHGDLCSMDGCQYLHQQPWAKDIQNTTADSRYIPQCHPEDGGNFSTRCKMGQCCKVGPDMDKVYDILRTVKHSGGDEGSQFPLFRIKESDGILSIQIHTWRKSGNKLPFATISHVWSQGLGNKEENTAHECQLRFIRKLLEAVGVPSDSSTLSAPFWLDTFAIPVRCKALQGRASGSRGAVNANMSPDDFNELKQLSIRQIYDVFEASTQAIVIDKDLCQQRVMGKPIEASMKLLTSTWMRRLWTLQEAFLSKTICISFESRLDIHRTSDNPHDTPHPGWDFDILLQQLNGNHDEEKTLQAAMAGILRQQLIENLMGKERQSRNLADVSVSQKGSTLIASAWRSVRWRTTSRLEDETLALATLLHLSYRDTTISQAGGVVQGLAKPDAARQRDGMMRDFWTLINRRYKGSIPAGMIFLPLDRLTFPGFGWSPRSWMSSTTDIEPESYPYPLSQMKYPTELLPEGLVVQYPGIILHCTRPETFLAQKEEGFTFDFPVDRGFNEWYTVGKHIERVEPDATEIAEAKQTLWFAIILSRPQPRERPDEIGLLVEVYNLARRQNEGESQDHEIYFCRIINRVHIRRSRPNFFNGLTDDRLIGELTSVDQYWCVDDYKPCRDRIRAEEDEKSRKAQALKKTAKITSDDKSILARMQGILPLMRQAPFAVPETPRPAETSGGGKGKEPAVPVRRETSFSTSPARPSSVPEENNPLGKMARSFTGTVAGQFNRIATLAKGE